MAPGDRSSEARLRVRLETDRMFGVDLVRKGGFPAPAPAAVAAASPAPAGTPARPAESFVLPADPEPATTRAASPAVPGADRAGRLAGLAERLSSCKNCGLSRTRKNLVFGEGRADAEILFVGEAPGADEDVQGRPFVGKAGQLLTKIIEAMGLRREDVFIANVLKCRPPENRDPAPDEVSACLPALQEQVEIIGPKVIVALGGHSYRALTGAAFGGITSVRGKFSAYRGIPVMPTFHPAYLLRNESEKRKVWEDMKKVLAKLGRAAPGKGAKE